MDGYQEKKESNTVYSQRKTYQKRNSSHRSQKIHSGDIIPQQSKDNHYKEGVYTRISTGRRSTGRQSGTPGQSGRRRSQSAYGENRRRRSGAENNLREWEILEQENERDYQEYLAQKRKRREVFYFRRSCPRCYCGRRNFGGSSKSSLFRCRENFF